jgi:hypothetical protein
LPSACSFIVMVLRFVVDVHTTCFGLHGHLQVCMIFHYLFHVFLTSALIGCQWSASCPGRFTPGERAPISIVMVAGWAPEPVWKIWINFLTLGCPGSSQSPYCHCECKLLNIIYNKLSNVKAIKSRNMS